MSDTCHVRLMSVEMSVTTSGLMSIRMPDRMPKNGLYKLKYQPRLFGPRCKKYVINVFCGFLPEHTSSTMSEVMSAEDAKIDVRNSVSKKSPIECRKLCQIRSQNLYHLSVVAQGWEECCREVLEKNVV